MVQSEHAPDRVAPSFGFSLPSPGANYRRPLLMIRPFGITEEQWELLLANGQAASDDDDFDACPVVKLCLPDGRPMILLAELNPIDHDLAFGLVDLVFRTPMLRFVSLAELSEDAVGRSLIHCTR